MNQFTATSLIELLDRKYQFVINAPLDNLMLDLKAFIEFLANDELIQPFTNKVIHQTNGEFERYQKQLAKETETAVQLKSDS